MDTFEQYLDDARAIGRVQAITGDDLSQVIEELVEVVDRRHPTSVRPLGGTTLGNAVRAAFAHGATPVGWRPERW